MMRTILKLKNNNDKLYNTDWGREESSGKKCLTNLLAGKLDVILGFKYKTF